MTVRTYKATVTIDSIRYADVRVRLDPPTFYDTGLPKGGATKADIVYATIHELLNPLYPTPEALNNRLRIEGGMIYQSGKSVPMCLCSAKVIECMTMDPFAEPQNL